MNLVNNTPIYIIADKLYPEYLQKFDSFFDSCIETSDAITNISFTHNHGEKHGTMTAFGRSYSVELEFIISDNIQTAILDVFTENHYEKGRNHIDRWFFDKLGNIRKTIDSADYFQYPISDLKFIEAFMDGVLSKHFLIIRKQVGNIN